MLVLSLDDAASDLSPTHRVPNVDLGAFRDRDCAASVGADRLLAVRPTRDPGDAVEPAQIDVALFLYDRGMDQGRTPPARWACATCAAFAHLLLVWFVIDAPDRGFGVDRAAVGPTIDVELVNAPRQAPQPDDAPPPAIAARPPPPPPRELKVSPEPAARRPQPHDASTPVPAPEAQAAPTPRRAEEEPAAAPIPPARAAFPRAEEEPSAERAAASARAAATWRGELAAYLNRFKRYPRGGGSGVAIVVFAIDRAGRVLDLRLARSSGDALLDQAALGMISRASPVPRPPSSAPGERITFSAPVRFHAR